MFSSDPATTSNGRPEPASGAADEPFGRAARLAARLLGVPAAGVVLVGVDGVRAEGTVGPTGTSAVLAALGREVAVGGAPVERAAPTDGGGDSAGLGARLGVPVRADDGGVLGALCVAAHGARAWTDADRDALADLAPLVAGVLGRRADAYALAEQQALLVAERRFTDATLDALLDIFFVLSPDGRLRRWNRRLPAVTGYTDDELADLHVADLFHPTDAADVAAAIREVVRRGAHVVELDLVTKNGRSVPFEFSGSLQRDAAGQVRAVCGTGRDLTDRHRAAEALDRSRQRYVRLVNGIDGAVWEGTIDTRTHEVTYTFVSERLRSVLGYAPEDWVRDAGRWAAAIVEEERAEVLHACLTTSLERRDHTLEYRMRTADGRVVWVRDIVSVLGEQDGVLAVGGIIIDVTERKDHERALVEAKEAAEVAARLKDTFVANMSHEIRTPLTSIIGFADVLAAEVPEEQRELADMICRSGRRLHETLKSVLDLSQLQSGMLSLYLQPVDVAGAVRQTAATFEGRAAEKGLTLRVDVRAEPPAAPVPAQADPEGLRRVLANLLDNAVKFTDRGGVSVRLQREEDAVVVEIADTGIGIGPDFRPQLFEAFRQESTGLSRSHEGSGLGLAIVKQLADRMGCAVEVESVPGAGSTFRLRLPAAAADAEAAAPTRRLRWSS